MHGVCLSVSVSVSWTLCEPYKKTDQPIEMPFGVWTRENSWNHVLGGGLDIIRGRGNILIDILYDVRQLSCLHFIK